MVAMGVIPRSSSAQPTSQVSHHVVKAGETLSHIAAAQSVRVKNLRDWNSIEGDRINVGDRLVISDPRSKHINYRAQKGDTLSCIALRHGVSQAALRGWNESLGRKRLRPGQRLKIFQPRMRFRRPMGSVDRHVVRRGETVSSIAARYGATTSDLAQWNPTLQPDLIRVGQRLVIETDHAPSESVGTPSCGQLFNGRVVPDHSGYVVRNRKRSFGSEQTIELLENAFNAVVSRHKGISKVRVHDLSLEGGGPIDDHRSHQSGLDVDLTYYQKRCGARGCPLRPVKPGKIDVTPQWTLLEALLLSNNVKVMFVDYSLQGPLYAEAKRRGATADQLKRWFQYPSGKKTDGTVIRHLRNHVDHIHIRFDCPPSDRSCLE